jgi:hypothetical protein
VRSIASRHLSLVLLLPFALVSCGGSQSYQDSLRSAVSDMRGAISTYNRAKPGDLASTGASCVKALDALKGAQKTLVQGSPPSQLRWESRALKEAYVAARDGFADCARAAPALDYALMYRADRELARANGWILEARRLDR